MIIICLNSIIVFPIIIPAIANVRPKLFQKVLSTNGVIILHNHPSTQTLSIEDIRFFLHFATVKVISVVSNQGTVHYLMKTDKYEYETAKGLYNECVEDLNKESSKKDIYLASLSFLSKCSEVGLFYS